MRRSLALLAVASLPLTACSKSPTEPSGGGGSTVLQGQTVYAIDGAAAPNLTVRIGDRAVTSDGSGHFQLDISRTGTYPATIRGNGVVDRETRVSGASDPLRLSLIPSSFDLAAFDEMFRTLNSRLARWTTRPALVVLAAVMDYRGTGETYEATGEQLTDDEVSQMIAHHTEGLALLTGGVYTNFASVDVERPASGTRVNPLRAGTIVVGRYRGIVSFARTIGYGQWSEMADGTINGGATFLDREFDRGDSRRRLLRIHELGHALGYQHVESRASIMNPSIGPEPNDFDRAGAIIAFQRPVGNRAPDVDPPTTAAAATGEYRWSAPTVCR
ncbi:MAG TPA: matrixin family metalloprotease [Vicinamibacterales bacterium]|nr:matrixin family metalloprotease [Vicinamibacterales bacterium]